MSGERRRSYSIGVALDWFFFVFAGISALWLAYLSFTESFRVGWWGILVAIAFWALLAYLVLPRIHRILTTIYVPGYFIGRTRTSDGLLGDPVNLAFMGEEAALHEAMEHAGWTLADPVTLRSSLRIVTSTLTRRSYHRAPVSPLFLFGRMQDFAYQQEVDGNPAQRHHVRFWRCPDDWPLPGGRRVEWLAAGTFDSSVGLSLFTLQVTHRIDADTDVERDHIVSSLLAADPTIRVEIIEDFSTSYHARNGGGDSIRTDGDLPILDLRPLAVAEAAAIETGHDTTDGSLPASDSSAGVLVSAATTEAPQGLPRKRAAFEPPTTLFAPLTRDPRMRRPATITTGTLLLLLRVLAGIALIIGLWAEWPDVMDSADLAVGGDVLTAEEEQFALWIVIALMGVSLAVQVSVVLSLWWGRNWARLIVMVFAVISISTAFTTWFLREEEITLRTSLLAVGLDVLILLALSSRSAAAYSRRRERRR
ncbi:LssY C-terminal domain-containing protein [Microbacterium sp. NPDC076895]|uniref:LssY C-terminal domain-containing protein n=1 Tax=Microbacterium sp. NPDC076895 TaxID=3154957 RepID=UPI0034220E6C